LEGPRCATVALFSINGLARYKYLKKNI